MARHCTEVDTKRDFAGARATAPGDSAPPPPDVGPEHGRVLAGKYRVERVLGEGGMGVVVAATHLALGELVAVKLLRRGADVDEEEARARFDRETRAAARLRSDHVARIHDAGVLDDGTQFLVLEYLEGQDLDAWLSDSGRLPATAAVGAILEACEALAEAHANGIVHRDIKPGNLFLAAKPDGASTIKVLDFGISRLLDRALAESSAGTPPKRLLTRGAIGTPPYVAPEQILCASDVDARADIWALGATLYELLTGEVPFKGRSSTLVCMNILEATPRPPSETLGDLPDGLDAVVLRCLEKEPGERFADVGELARALVPFGPEDAERSARTTQRLLTGGSTTPIQGRLADPVEVQEPPRARVSPPPPSSEPAPSPQSGPPGLAHTTEVSRRPMPLSGRRARTRTAALAAIVGTSALLVWIVGVAIGKRIEQPGVRPGLALHGPRERWRVAAARSASAAGDAAASGRPAAPEVEPGASEAAAASSPAAASAAPTDRTPTGRPARSHPSVEDLFDDRK